MNINGVKVTEAQFAVLSKILEHNQIDEIAVNARTAWALTALGLIELFVPETETYAMAARGHVRYYRLTAAGKEAVNTATSRTRRD